MCAPYVCYCQQFESLGIIVKNAENGVCSRGEPVAVTPGGGGEGVDQRALRGDKATGGHDAP